MKRIFVCRHDSASSTLLSHKTFCATPFFQFRRMNDLLCVDNGCMKTPICAHPPFLRFSIVGVDLFRQRFSVLSRRSPKVTRVNTITGLSRSINFCSTPDDCPYDGMSSFLEQSRFKSSYQRHLTIKVKWQGQSRVRTSFSRRRIYRWVMPLIIYRAGYSRWQAMWCRR